MRKLSGLVLGVALVGCGSGTSADRTGEILATSSDASSGSALYESNCASCHGSNGGGGAGPALSGGGGKVGALSDTEIVDVILSGAPGMPGYSVLSNENIADILAHLRSAFGS